MAQREIWNLEEIKRRIEELPARKKTAVLRKFPHLAMKDEVLEAMTPEEVEEVWQHLEEDPPEEIDKAKREAEAAKRRMEAFLAKWEEPAKRMAELPKEIEKIKEEIAVLERDIPKMAPGPLRTAAELELVKLERRLDRATAELERLTLKPELAEEIKTLRTELELVAKDLGDRFAKLEKAVAERVAVPPLEVERLKRMTEEIEAFRERLAATTMALTYGIPLGMAWRRLYEDRLWAERMRKGEVEVTESFASARNRFESLHHIPTSETYVRVTPLV